MSPVDIADAPRGPRTFAELALANGWSVTLTSADGPPASIALRARRGRVRVFVIWRVDKGVHFRSAAHNVVGGGMWLGTLRNARKVIESDADAIEAWLAGAA